MAVLIASAPLAAGAEEDADAYRRAGAEDTIAAYEAYLARFPHGRFSAEAFYCVVVARQTGEGCGIDGQAGPLPPVRRDHGIVLDLP